MDPFTYLINILKGTEISTNDKVEVIEYKNKTYISYLDVIRDSAKYRYESDKRREKLKAMNNDGNSVFNISSSDMPAFVNSADKNYWRDIPIGYGNVYILKGSRTPKIREYVEFTEEAGHPNYVKLSEDVFSPANTAFWNNFHPMFASYITAFAGVLNQKKIITGRIPIVSGFRTADYAAGLAKRNDDAVTWSPHRAGIAVDITCKDDAQRDKVLAEAYAFGFGGLGRGSYYCHIDIGAEGSWGYGQIAPFTSTASR